MAKKDQDRAVIVEGEITADTVRRGFAILLILVVGWIGYQAYSKWQMGSEVSVSQVVQDIENNNVQDGTIAGSTVTYTTKDGTRRFTILEPNVSLVQLVQNDGYSVKKISDNLKVQNFDLGSSFLSFATAISLLAIPLGIWWFIRMLQQQSAKGDGLLSSFGKSPANVIIGKRPNVTFNDVAGAKEAKEEIKEVVDFLRDPKAFFDMGARIPRGVLLVGEPGTGKTLLARAVAGEAHVPFFHTSGPEFEEMLVGAGAARVRDLFKRAKNLAPSIVFIDEIDAVARRRGMDYKSSHSEQTLNQILVEMDGFEKRDAVIVIAATNRPDVLDPAILRPGRFDRTVRLSLPDVKERQDILMVHAKNKKLGPDVDLEKIAQFTVGFSGADLENVLNEAAILAVRAHRNEIIEDDVREATLKVSMGPRRGSLMMSEEELRATAYHEAGHAIVATYLEHVDAVKAVTIVPRGISLGMTMQDETERHASSKVQLLETIAVLSGGRVAEELVFGKEKIATGASNDLERASKIASTMVKTIGMSDKIGFVQLDKEEDFDILTAKKTYSDETAQLIDEEITRIMEEQYEVARGILKREHKLLDVVADALHKQETLDESDFMKLVNEFGSEKPPVKVKPRLQSVLDWIKLKQNT